MKLMEAREIILEVHGKSYSWLLNWGISTIRMAIYTILDRKTATKADVELARGVEDKLNRKW